jgi:NADH-quinone oxidoreductase subunit M
MTLTSFLQRRPASPPRREGRAAHRHIVLYWLAALTFAIFFGSPAVAQATAGVPTASAAPAGAPSTFGAPLAAPGGRLADASANVAPHGGRIKLSIDGRETGPLELTKKGDGYVGEFNIEDDSPDALTVTRVAMRGDDDDVRLPPKFSVRFVDGGGTGTTIAPHTSKKVQVTWLPDRAPRVQQAFGHVIVTSSDEGQGEVAMGIKAQIEGPLGFITEHILTLLTFIPLLGLFIAFGMYLAGSNADKNLRWVAVAITLVECVLAIILYQTFNGSVTRADGNDGFQFIEHVIWVRSFNIEYFVGVDGSSISMVLLTAIVGFVGAVASFSVEKQLKGYFAMYCLLLTGMMGVFVALDLFLFYVFWEVMLLPMYFLIGIWGGPRKEYAAIKFFLYTLAGSVFMLLAFIALYFNADKTFLVDGTAVDHTFSIPELMRVAFAAKHLTILGLSLVKVVWVALFVGFAIKIPMFPFHTWLPDAHVEAPTAISVILAGVLLKMGTYGIIRINFGLLPDATRWAAGAMVAFGVINILYGAFCAMAQEDLKKLVAYSSVSHMGFCLVGLGSLTPQGIAACIVQMFNHGIITSMLFTLVGVVYDRVHTRDLSKFGGLAGEMPLYTTFVGFAFMASLGLPGLSGFWGEALTFMGAFPTYRFLTTLAATGVIFTAAYHLWALQRMFLGKFRESWRNNHYLEPFGGRFPEINMREVASLAPLVAICLILGFYPMPLLSLIAGGVSDVTQLVNPTGPDQIAHAARHAGDVLSMFH